MAEKTEKHLAYFAVLDAIEKADGCPLCALEKESARRNFESVLYELVNDPWIRADLKHSRGYCPRHAHLLLAQEDAFATAVLYRDQIELALRLLDHLRALNALPRRLLRRGTRSWWSQRAQCPACRAQAQDRNRYAGVLVEGLRDEQMRAAFDASPGLCLPHFSAAIGVARSADLRRHLIDAEQVKLRDLLHDLEEFCRKQDYQFRQEGFGKEADAWQRAVRMMIGDEEVF